MTTKIELVFVPTPWIGHLVSTVELAKFLVDRHPNISIAILIINLPFDSAVSGYVDRQSRDLSSLTFHLLPTPSNIPNSSSPSSYTIIIDLYKPFVKQVLESRVGSGSTKPAGLVLDIFCTTMMDIGDDLNIPTYFYCPSGANFMSFLLHSLSLVDGHGIDISTQFSDPDKEVDRVLGFKNPVPNKVVPAVLLDKEFGCPTFINHTRRYKYSKGILLNTFTELESGMMQALVDLQSKGKIPPVYAVGPIMDLGNREENESSEEIMRWLDQQPESSVVFLCFGSRGYFSEDQMKQIATGLLRSGHRFLWSLRQPPSGDEKFGVLSKGSFKDSLPEGFLEQTADRGKIIGWAPQASVLAHRALGGFVSHCGWNSILESIWFGVPIATWPLYAEQQLNAFMLVKELGISVEIRMDYRLEWHSRKENMLVTADEIENGVKKLMSMDKETKEKVKKMSKDEKEALQQGGSSCKDLDRFVDNVLDNVIKQI